MTEEKKEELPSCCQKNGKAYKGILYGIIPHIGCILFVIASILGSTVLISFFKPLLMNRNIFYYMIAISAGFATLSAMLYLRKNKMLSWSGVKRKKGYLTIMYGTTVGINILFFFLIFPLMANIGGVNAQVIGSSSLLKMSVAIPCAGHASLITNELKTIEGVEGVQFSLPNNFAVYYDSTRTSKEEMLELEVFKEYPAKIIEEGSANEVPKEDTQQIQQPSITGNAISTNGVQEISMNVDSNGYSPNSFAIKPNIPVKWNINVKQLTGCNQELVMRDYGIDVRLKQGLNTIEFTPTKTGTISFTCGMGMLRGSFIVTESGTATQQQLSAAAPKSGGGCGCGG